MILRPDRRELIAGLAAGIAITPAFAAPKKLPMPDAALWDPAVAFTEGEATGPNGAVYHRVYGKPGRTPVITLHGGPAGGERYMRAYAGLATDRQVVLYDQSGCGRSARPADLTSYTLDRYVAELEALRAHLGFEKVVLLGHSWGGILAPAYAALYPHRVEGMVLAGTAVRWRDFEDAAAIWLAELGPEAVATVAAAKASGNSHTPEYGALLERYYALHLCRLDPWPAWFVAEGEKIDANPVYAYLNGPSEFQFTGAFGNLDMTNQLKALPMPTLVTCGEFDEGPPAVARKIVAIKSHAKLVVFDGCSHMSHIEDPKRVIGTTAAFLRTLA